MWTHRSGGGCGAAGLREGTPVATAAVAAASELATLHLSEVAVISHPWPPTPCTECSRGTQMLCLLCGLQLLTPASGSVYSEQAPSQYLKDLDHSRQPWPLRF